LKQVPIVLLPVTKLYAGGEQLLNLDEEFNVQLSKRRNYSDLKKRIVDCINARNGTSLTDSDIRLWKFSDHKEKLVDACKEISERNKIEVDHSNDEDLEYNSGVEFPGDSLEPYMNTPSTLEDDTLNEAYVIAEIREDVQLQYAF
jgi:hypothetical protein